MFLGFLVILNAGIASATEENGTDITNSNTLVKTPTLKSSQSTSTGDKNYAAGGSVEFTNAQVGTASTSVKNYIERYHTLPAYVTVGNTKVSIYTYLHLATTSVQNRYNKNNNVVYAHTYKAPQLTKDSIHEGSMSKAEYIKIADQVKVYMDKTGVTPGYAYQTSLGTYFGYKSMIYMYSKILNSYQVNGVLPGSVVVKPWKKLYIVNPDLPEIDGKRVVWQQDSAGHTAIYVENLQTGVNGHVSASAKPQKNADISGTRVVWQQEDSPNHWAIYVKNLQTGLKGRVLSSTKNQENPAISGTRVVWQQEDSPNHWAIYIKNLQTGKVGKILSSTKNQGNPAISGTRVVWQQEDSPDLWSIYINNLEKGTRGELFTSTQNQCNPDISGNRVVWQQKDSSGRGVIYAKNIQLGTVGRVLSSTQNQFNPSINGIGVVWQQGYSSDDSHIHVKNLQTGQDEEAQKSTQNQKNAAISGIKVIWIQQGSSGNTDLYMKDLQILNPLRVTTTDPGNNAGNVPVTKLIRINFDRLISNANKALIELRSSSGELVPITISVTKEALFIDHSPLSGQTTYTLTLKPNCVKDYAGNAFLSTYTTKFKTGNYNTYFSGYLIIPKLGISPYIYHDTLNHYNGVYYFPNSVYPGTPGECAVIGHRTTYSGQMRYINSLVNGDLVYIHDYTARKKITYRVAWNGDIRYYANPYYFNYRKGGASELIVMSCYPVGYGTHKWLCHCVLESTVAL